MFQEELSTEVKMCLGVVRHVVFGTAHKCASMQHLHPWNSHDDDDDDDAHLSSENQAPFLNIAYAVSDTCQCLTKQYCDNGHYSQNLAQSETRH
jgi:hypothetical protein